MHQYADVGRSDEGITYLPDWILVFEFTPPDSYKHILTYMPTHLSNV